MERLMYGLAQHKCEALGQAIVIPIGMEKYSSKVIVSAKCQICGKMEFEKTVDKSFLPTKAAYITA
jgi:hypothetical protein